jgi:hypothetical protein
MEQGRRWLVWLGMLGVLLLALGACGDEGVSVAVATSTPDLPSTVKFIAAGGLYGTYTLTSEDFRSSQYHLSKLARYGLWRYTWPTAHGNSTLIWRDRRVFTLGLVCTEWARVLGLFLLPRQIMPRSGTLRLGRQRPDAR